MQKQIIFTVTFFTLLYLSAISTRATTITVNTANNETGTGASCSLYEAMTAANTNAAFGGCPAGQSLPAVDRVVFNIAGGGVRTIVVSPALPTIIETVNLDASTQSGANCTTGSGLLIDLAGASAGNSGFRLMGNAGGSTIKGFVIRSFPIHGIFIDTAGNNSIVCNSIGLSASGIGDAGNAETGITIQNSSNNVIGGTTAAERNYVSGNGRSGIAINDLGPGATGNKVIGNFIGTNALGTSGIRNDSDGISITGADNNVIGDEVNGAGNLISGNGNQGISIASAVPILAGNNSIKNNIIGLDATGTKQLANTGRGIQLEGALNTTVGGSASLARNIISGNLSNGIMIQLNSAGTLVRNNFFGTDINGTVGIGNAGAGVTIYDSSNNTIGGLSANERNLIAGNGDRGIDIAEASFPTNGNRVLGNFIGTNVSGNSAISNNFAGIVITNADNNSIGDDVAGAGNLISGNAGDAIFLDTGADDNSIQNNHIGTQADGTSPLPNSGHGILLSSANNNLIGGSGPGSGNVIAANSGDGVTIQIASSGNSILGNSIYGNDGLGIDLSNNGVTPNDVGDIDGGQNNQQNYPVITTVNGSSGSTQIIGALNSQASRTYRVEFFTSVSPNNSGFGEGRFFIGAANFTTNGSGTVSINTIIPVGTSNGWVVTATATDLTTNDTSEFSQARVVSGPTAAGANVGGRVTDDIGRPLVMARVTLTDARGVWRTTFTSPFGYYNFDTVASGQSVVLAVTKKGFDFAPRLVNVTGEISEVNVVGIPANE